MELDPAAPPKPVQPVDSIVKRRKVLVPILVVVFLVAAGVAFYIIHGQTPRGDVLATVNGEPIYAQDIADTLSLIPSNLRTDQQRESLLNQSIELVLLKQEARRRSITVSEPAIDNRISLILNDTGHSPAELRLILEDHNMTPQQFRDVVRDMLLVEAVINDVVSNHVTVSEQEINDYYQSHQADFLPPPGGARISLILVSNESEARDIIAALNRGESFRTLAAAHSIDGASAAQSGSYGILSPTDSVDPAFRNAALGLRENQYTNVPIKTSAGYEVILRNFDAAPVQQVRDGIQQTLLHEKEQTAFAAFLDGIRASADIRFYTPNGVISAVRPVPRSLDAFSACVAAKGTLYVANWSDASNSQLSLFGNATTLLAVVDCEKEPTACSAVGIEKYPTWLIDSKKTGALSLTELSQRTGCALPQ